LTPRRGWISFLGTSGPVRRGSPRGRSPAASSSRVRTRSGAARAHTYNLGLARMVMEVRLARAGPSRSVLRGRREHARGGLMVTLLRVVRMRFPRLKAGTSAIEFVTWFDTTLTPLRAQYGATCGKPERRNRPRYAGSASPSRPLQRMNNHT
jgi:hypothetical protein